MKLQRILLTTALSLLAIGASYGASPDDNDRCSRIQMGDWDKSVVRAEEDFTVPNSGSALKLIAHRNGGLSVHGTDTGNFKIHVCKVASADNKAEAERILSQIRVQNNGGTIQPTGPEGNEWVAFLLVEAPRTASVDAETTNGPLSFRDMTGTLTATAKNGPVSFKNVSGSVTANVRNGPVSFRGNSGDIKLNAENGPIAVRLEGDNWSGGGLSAESTNGPLSVSLPESYSSGVEINVDGSSPVSCDAKGCDTAQKVQNGRVRKINFGSGNPVVHIATRNGPVQVSNSHAEY
ncbi:MAG: hypothetical protein NVS9B15_20010 [Acidobacteriaceae bacterium]